MYCNNCGSLIENKNATFCASCGKALKMQPKAEPVNLDAILDNDDNQMADNVQEMKCPACGAPIALDAATDAVVCDYCGTKVFVDDEIYKYRRILRAQSEAKNSEAKAQYELEKERDRYEIRRDLLNTFKENPTAYSAVIVCTIWFITNLISGRLGFVHILIEIGVIMWATGANKRKKTAESLGFHVKSIFRKIIRFIFGMLLIVFLYMTLENENAAVLALIAFIGIMVTK